MKKYSKGFTLIELLVVIAIIGILSSVVLASLNTARTKGSNAAVKSAMGQIRAQAEMYYDGNSQSYGGTADTGITASCGAGFGASTTAMITNITGNSNAAPTCYIGKQVWAIDVTLKDSTKWCVDSTGLAAAKTAQNTGICQ